jgi:pimeloyl-ACP methyl ester carboxylesterase
MPYVQIAGSDLLPGTRPIDLYYRELGPRDGAPLVILHGGWGYEFYPFDEAIAALPERRIVIPDRTGYGRSPRLTDLPARFHHAAAREHEALLDALGIERAAIWGHSDGAVIAAIMALHRPARVSAVILEALHLDRAKPGSREFFATMVERPDEFGPRVTARLAAEHGDPGWRAVVGASGRAWLAIARDPDQDFFDHRLAALAVPALVIQGVDDPRTEPGELDRLARDAPSAEIYWVAGGGHAPHCERKVRAEVTERAASFLASPSHA